MIRAAFLALMMLTVPTNHRWPVVYVENRVGTHSGWGIDRAVRLWGSGLRYGHCRVDAGCIYIYAPDQGPTGWLGTFYHPETSGGPAKIVLNWYYAEPAGGYWYLERRHEAVLHELGHALGLHHDRSGGCMAATDTGRNNRVSTYERRELGESA